MLGGGLIEEMAVAIWARALGKPHRRPRGPVPPAAVDAAGDLGELYERMNDADLEEIAARFPTPLTGDELVAFAMTPGMPFVTQMKVPRFSVTLDGDELTWEGGERNIRNPAAGDGFWVLLIEDEPSKQVSTTRMIKKLYPTAQVIVSDNGPAAIANLETHDVKLVISDVDILGTMSGVDVFRWVQANQPHLVDQYVFFSGNDSGDLYEGVTPIHYRILQKPAGVKDLGDAIRAPGPREARRTTPQVYPSPIARGAQPAPATQGPEPVAQAVNTVIRTMGHHHGRLVPGSSKVWIAAVYRAAIAEGLINMSLPEFKRVLVMANQKGLVSLARQDIRNHKDVDIATESEIVDRGATFNFVIDPAGTPW